MSNKPLIRGLVLASVLFAASVSGAIVAPTTGAAWPAEGSHHQDGAVTDQPGGAAVDLRTSMVDVADRRGSHRAGTTVVLLVANAMMLGVGAVLLWRRCVTTDREVSS